MTAKDILQVELLVQDASISRAFNNLYSEGERLGKLSAQGFGVTPEIDNLRKQIDATAGAGSDFHKSFEQGMDTGIKKVRELNNRFNMQILTFLFAGYAAQRLGQAIFRFLIPNFEKLEGRASEGQRRIMALRASFEFLRFSMFETLSQTELFRNVIQFFIELNNRVGLFVQQHPNLLKMLAVSAALLFVFGAMGIAVGIIGQIDHALRGLRNTLISVSLAATGGAGLMGFAKAHPVIMGLVGAALLLAAAAFTNEEGWEAVTNMWNNETSPAIGGLVTRILEAIGANVEWRGTWDFLGRAASTALLFAQGGLITVIDFIHIATDVLMNLLDIVRTGWNMLSGFAGMLGGVLGFDTEDWVAKEFTDAEKALDRIANRKDMRFTRLEESSRSIQLMRDEVNSLWSNTVETEDATEELSRAFLDLTPSVEKAINQTAIPAFEDLGNEIVMDHEYFNNLESDIEDWASYVTTKIIEIQYRVSGAPSGIGAPFGDGQYSSSITSG